MGGRDVSRELSARPATLTSTFRTEPRAEVGGDPGAPLTSGPGSETDRAPPADLHFAAAATLGPTAPDFASPEPATPDRPRAGARRKRREEVGMGASDARCAGARGSARLGSALPG